jgi:hypothetical protein
MPVYNCYRGHAEGIALEKEGCFAIRDLRGRDWTCFESNLPILAGTDRDSLIQENAKEIAERTARFWNPSLPLSHSACTVVECSDVDELPRMLAESRDPGEPSA